MAEGSRVQELWREELHRLRNNDAKLTVLSLPMGNIFHLRSAVYIYHPSGQFVGSELESSLKHNTVLKSISLSLTDFYGKIDVSCLKSTTWQNLMLTTLDGLRCCSLPLSLDLRQSRYVEPSRVKQLGEMLKISSTLTALDLRHNGIGQKNMDVLLSSLETSTNLTSLKLSFNPTVKILRNDMEHKQLKETTLTAMFQEWGINERSQEQHDFVQSSGKAICDFLGCIKQLKVLVLDELQTDSVDNYLESRRTMLLAFAQGLHPRLGQR
jgi:hypothetical protein